MKKISFENFFLLHQKPQVCFWQEMGSSCKEFPNK